MDDAGRSDPRTWIHAVLDEYERPLVRYAARITGDLETARDVVQETFLKLCSDGAPRDANHVGPWLYTVCRNRARDVCRKDGRMKTLTETHAETCTDAGPLPAAAAELSEASQRVQQLLTGLSENEQDVIRLRFQNGLSYRDIAAVTGLSVSNVGYLIHTAIKTIRTRVGADADIRAAAADRTGGES